MTEYEVTESGVQLLGGRVWQEHDHLNVRTEEGTVNYHAEAKCAATPAPPECSPIMVSAAQNIGADFIPWDALGIAPPTCIEWVQFSRANYHYGEGGEQPLCLTEEQPPVTPEKPGPVFRWVTGEPLLDCESSTVTVVSTEEAAGYYLGNDDQWHLGGFFPTGNTDTKTIPASAEECPVTPPVPPVETPAAPERPTTTSAAVPASEGQAQLAVTGAPDVAGGLLAVVLVAAGLAAVVAGKLGARRAR